MLKLAIIIGSTRPRRVARWSRSGGETHFLTATSLRVLSRIGRGMLLVTPCGFLAGPPGTSGLNSMQHK